MLGNSCDPDAMRWNRFVRYYFYDYKNQNELISAIQKFKMENPQYDVFQVDTDGNIVSIDSIYKREVEEHGGNDNRYISFYLKDCQSVVLCFVRPYKEKYNNHDNSVYLLNYSDIPLCEKDSLAWNFQERERSPIERNKINKEIRVRLNELYKIFDKFGKYKKLE